MTNMQAKMRLASLVNSPAWQDVIKLAETSLVALEREAIDEEDDNKAVGLRRDAKGARKFWLSFLLRLNISVALSDEPTNDTWLDICN